MRYEAEFAKLNEYQRAAVEDDSNACLVNANVGSGKTTVLITKVMYLHYKKQIPYENMVVLTFTNKAADEIRERLIKLEETVTEEQLRWFGTFHGVCLSLLKKVLPVESLGYTKDFLVMTPEEEVLMAEQLILEHQLKIKYKNRLKKRLEQAMAIVDEEKKISKYQDDIFLLTDLMRGEKKKQNKMTYQDLLDNAGFLLARRKKGESQAEDIFSPDWIIIDEVQDCDGRQLELLSYMKEENTSLFAVGDPNQVIYSWRGSALNVFYTLKSKYQARELSLPINYRSSGSILEAARFFLQNGSRLEGVKDSGSKIVVKNHYNPFQEADYLASKIKELHEQGVPYREIAIFYRLQGQSGIFEDVFTREEIPFEVSLKKSIQDIPVLNWFLRVLRYAANREDITSGVLALCDREYGVMAKEKDALRLCRAYARKDRANVSEKQGPENSKQQMPKDESENVSEKTEQSPKSLYLEEAEPKLLIQMLHFSEACEQGLKIEQLMEYFELKQYLAPTSATFSEDVDAVERLLSLISDYLIEEGQPLCEGIRLFLNHAALYGMSIFENKIDTKQDSVKLMTLHASKGLEFSHVFITGINYGLIPLQSKGMDAEEEERRLFFVGITRAKDYLELSYYTSPQQYRAMPGPSRFLSMIPGKLVTDESKQSGTVMDTSARLQEIKRQILASRTEMQYLFPEEETQGGHRKETEVSNTKEGETLGQVAQRVSHAKYGIGVIIGEDDDNVTVKFEDYGEKEFLKLFSELEYLE